jgi:hypothetical protein
MQMPRSLRQTGDKERRRNGAFPGGDKKGRAEKNIRGAPFYTDSRLSVRAASCMQEQDARCLWNR